MPLDNFITRPDFSRQIKQFSGTTAFLGGSTNISEKLVVKNIEIDTVDAQTGHVLIYDGTKFLPAPSGAYGNTILNGMILSYFTGLTYNVSEGSYRISGVTYVYTGGSVTINSGNILYNRFDIIYVTGYSNTYISQGTPSAAPTVPTLTPSQLGIGIISVPANFTGGTGTTVIQTTSATVFEFYNVAGTGIQRSPASSYNAEAIGDYSFALSRDAKAYGQDTVALGLGTQASGYGQTVVGQYNSLNSTDIFIVGSGSDGSNRANAFRVTTGGTVYVTNKLFVSNYEIETTGATNNQALVYNGTKFTPQTVTGSGGGITALTSAGTGNISILSSITNNNLIYKTISAGTGISIIESADGTLLFSGSSTNPLTATSLGDGIKILFSSDTTTLSFTTLSSQTPSSLKIISSSTGVILFSATTGSGVGTLQQVTDSGNTTTNGISIGILSITSAWLNLGASQLSKPHINFSSGTDPSSPQVGDLWWNGSNLYFRKDASTTADLLGIGNNTVKTLGVTSGVLALGIDYTFNKIKLTSSTSSFIVSSITVDGGITTYSQLVSIRFFAETGYTATFINSTSIKTEGGLDGIISGSTYDNIVIDYNPDSQKFYQTNINNYI